MAYSQQQITQLTEPLRLSLGDNITWSYDERLHMMLSEFAQNKSELILSNLRLTLVDEWQGKTWKKLPQPIKNELGNLAKLNKDQLILAVPANDQHPAMVALWWPWDHGGTYSLRIKLLETSYQNTPEHMTDSGVLSKLKRLFAVS